jgi:uncharacterized protein (TIGR02996 family)
MSKQAFLQAIFEEPEDDDLRLVYADWLEEHGDASESARANYIRLAVEKARLPRASQRRAELQRAMNQLLKIHRADWFPDSSLVKVRPRGRGFIWHARGTTDVFQKHAEALFAREPVTYLYLEPGGHSYMFPHFAANPLLRRLRHMDLPQNALPPGGLAALVQSGNLVNLSQLQLSQWNYNRDEFNVLVRADWPKLRHLFTLRCRLDDDALKSLVNLRAPRLTHLTLCTENFGATGLRDLQSAPWLGQLRKLSLPQMQGSFSNEILGEFLEDSRLANLRRLDVSHNPLGPDGITRLARLSHLANVEILNLGYTGAGAAGLLGIFESPHLRKLRDLSFSSNDVSFAGFPPRPRADGWPSLRSFYFGNKITDADFTWMLEHNLFTGPRRLYLSMAELTSASLVKLLCSPRHRRLHTLWMAMNPLGPPGDLPPEILLPRLHELDLSSSALTDAGAAKLLRAMQAPRLWYLNLYKNELGNETVHAISANPSFRNLEKLTLSHHLAINDESARILAQSKYLDCLRELQLFGTNVSKEGLVLLRKRFRRVYWS